MNATQAQPTPTPNRSLACDAAEARLLLAAAGSGEVVSLRRAVDPQPVLTTLKRDVPPGKGGVAFCKGWRWNGQWLAELGEATFLAACPLKVGDALDVLEPHAFINQYGVEVEADDAVGRRHKMTTVYEAGPVVAYRKPDGEMEPTDVVAWLPADSMPPWAVRMTLRVESVAVARSDAGAWCWEVVVKSKRKGATT